jgi:hypothetical protein
MTNSNYKLKFEKKTGNQILIQLSQAGTDKNRLQNRIPGITHLKAATHTEERMCS